jgi:hypothetical protein
MKVRKNAARQLSQQPVRVERDRYSAPSKRSQAWYRLPGEYQPISYLCHVCQRDAVWIPEEQKQDFEQKGLYIWARRKLCQTCYDRKMALAATLRQCQLAHAADRRTAALPLSFYLDWLQELEDHNRLGGRRNPAIRRMIQKALKRFPSQTSY